MYRTGTRIREIRSENSEHGRQASDEVIRQVFIDEAGAMRYSVLVEVLLRPGIADPEGATIERSLPNLGFEGISEVRTGKVVRFTIDAPDEVAARSEVDEMCARFLTNPVIEDATVHIEPLDGAVS